MYKKENHPFLSKPKASSEEVLSEGPWVHFYPQNWTVFGSATFRIREAGMVSIQGWIFYKKSDNVSLMVLGKLFPKSVRDTM